MDESFSAQCLIVNTYLTSKWGIFNIEKKYYSPFINSNSTIVVIGIFVTIRRTYFYNDFIQLSFTFKISSKVYQS